MWKAFVLSAELFSLQFITTEFVWQITVLLLSVGHCLTHVVTHSDCIDYFLHLLVGKENKCSYIRGNLCHSPCRQSRKVCHTWRWSLGCKNKCRLSTWWVWRRWTERGKSHRWPLSFSLNYYWLTWDQLSRCLHYNDSQLLWKYNKAAKILDLINNLEGMG